MLKLTCLSLCMLFVFGCSHSPSHKSTTANSDLNSKNPALLSWSSPEGVKRLARAEVKGDFFKLAPQYEPQKNKLYCAVAAATIVTNTIRPRDTYIELKPKDNTTADATLGKNLPKGFDPKFNRITQENFVSGKAAKVKNKAHIYGQPMGDDGKKDYGLQLRQMANMLKAHQFKTDLVIADGAINNAQIKERMIATLSDPNSFLIGSFLLQESLVKKGTGHASPIAAYDEKSDSFLVMDVHPYHTDWIWVDSKALINSMRTFDTVENRGFVTVTEGSTAAE